MFFRNIKDECYKKSLEILYSNSNKNGVLAAASTRKAKSSHYDSVFARDASICSLGMVSSGEKDLIEIARRSLEFLAERQTIYGQIPYSISGDGEEDRFYYLGGIDSGLWWLIALDFYDKNSGDRDLKKELAPQIKKTFSWLFCQDTNNDGLLEQGEASDWADYMPANGTVLYTNVLWYRALHLYGYEDERELTLDGLNNLFLPFEADEKRSVYLNKEIHRQKTLNNLKHSVEHFPYYLHYISYRYASDRCDCLGNSLAILFNVADTKKARDIIRYITENKINKKYPLKALWPPIKKKDIDYRQYLGEDKSLNKPNAYHNGGVWPFIAGFWILALQKSGQKDLAAKELLRLAELNKKDNWGFREWFDGKSFQPQGMEQQSWNAAMYILAYQVIENKFKI